MQTNQKTNQMPIANRKTRNNLKLKQSKKAECKWNQKKNLMAEIGKTTNVQSPSYLQTTCKCDHNRN